MDDIFFAVKLDDTTALENIIKSGCHLDERDDFGRTALHICATYGYEASARVLVRCGASLSIQDYESGWTPLHRSLYFRNLNVSLILIRAGAKLGDELTVSDWKMDVVRKRQSVRSIRDCHSWTSHIDHEGHSPLDLLSIHLAPYLSQSSSILNCTDLTVFGKADFPLGVPLPNSTDLVLPRRIESLIHSSVVEVAASKFHSMAVTKSGELYSWGHGRAGRLGHGDEATQPEPLLISALKGKFVVAISLAENHSICCTSTGSVYSWGSNRFGQLGYGAAEKISINTTPRKIESLRKLTIKSVAAGASHSVCVGVDGDIWTWGSNLHGQLGLKPSELVALDAGGTGTLKPQRVYLSIPKESEKSMKRTILQISASDFSTLVLYGTPPVRDINSKLSFRRSNILLTEVNELYQWGHGCTSPMKVDFTNRNRSLSTTTPTTTSKNRSRSRSNSMEIDDKRKNNLSQFEQSFANMKVNIIQISAGRYHNVAISSYCDVYTWGIVGSDVLGHGSQNNRLSCPQLVDALLPENGGGRAVFACATIDHTCVVTDTGDLYTWGTSPEKGVLGHGQGKYQPVPKRVVGIKKAVKVAGGDGHTIVLSSYFLPPLPYDHCYLMDTDIQTQSLSLSSSELSSDTRLRTLSSSSSSSLPLPLPLPWNQRQIDRSDSITSLHNTMNMTESDEEDEQEQEQDEIVSNELSCSPQSTINDQVNGIVNAVEIPSLMHFSEQVLASQVNCRTVLPLLEVSEIHNAKGLAGFCASFIKCNLDAILVQQLTSSSRRRSELDLLMSRLLPSDFMATADSHELSAKQEASNKIDVSSGSRSDRSSSSSWFDATTNIKVGPDTKSERIERLQSQDLETLEGVNKLRRACQKKLKEIQKLLSQQCNGMILSAEQLQKIDRKAYFEAELRRLVPFVTRLEQKQKLLNRKDKNVKTMSDSCEKDMMMEIAEDTEIEIGNVTEFAIKSTQSSSGNPPCISNVELPSPSQPERNIIIPLTSSSSPSDIQTNKSNSTLKQSQLVSVHHHHHHQQQLSTSQMISTPPSSKPSKQKGSKAKFIPLDQFVSRQSQRQGQGHIESTNQSTEKSLRSDTSSVTGATKSTTSSAAPQSFNDWMALTANSNDSGSNNTLQRNAWGRVISSSIVTPMTDISSTSSSTSSPQLPNTSPERQQLLSDMNANLSSTNDAAHTAWKSASSKSKSKINSSNLSNSKDMLTTPPPVPRPQKDYGSPTDTRNNDYPVYTNISMNVNDKQRSIALCDYLPLTPSQTLSNKSVPSQRTIANKESVVDSKVTNFRGTVASSSPSCPWSTPTKQPINNSSQNVNIPPSSTSTTTPTTPTTSGSLREIQLQEENERLNSNMMSLSGHDNPWFVERRQRVGSLENVMKSQLEEKEIEESKKKMEEEEAVLLKSALKSIAKQVRLEKMEKKKKKKQQETSSKTNRI